jgi:hypothetical protein
MNKVSKPISIKIKNSYNLIITLVLWFLLHFIEKYKNFLIHLSMLWTPFPLKWENSKSQILQNGSNRCTISSYLARMYVI